MFEEKWTLISLTAKDFQAAKQGVTVVSPHPGLGDPNDDQVSFGLPGYQRGLVWNLKHGQEFQAALKSGWPFGMLVMAERQAEALPGPAGKLRHFDIIDGQQRTYWFNRTLEHFFQEGLYSLVDDEVAEAFENLGRALGGVGAADIRASIGRWTADSGFRPIHLRALHHPLQFITHDLRISPPDPQGAVAEACTTALEVITNEIQSQYSQLQGLEVPALIIHREITRDLHEIFKRLNQGTTLSDLDLLAAEWSGIRVDLYGSSWFETRTKEELETLAANRIPDSYDLEGYDYAPELVQSDEEHFHLFDYLYALGRMLGKQYPATFGSLGKSTDRLVIFTAALLFGGSLGRRNILGDTFPDDKNLDSPDVTMFPAALFAAAKRIDGAMTKLNAVDAGKRLRGRMGVVQAATYLASYIALVYEVDHGVGDRMLVATRDSNDSRRLESSAEVWTPTRRQTAFQDNLVGWFLADVLGEVFQGTDAYSSAAARVWREYDPQGLHVHANEQMLMPVDLSYLSEGLTRTFRREANLLATPKQRRISEAASAIIRSAYASLPINISGEEVDHIVPFDARRGRSFPVAINHPANLMPSKRIPNASRRERFIPEYLADPRLDTADRRGIEERLLIPVDSASSSVVASREDFESFLRNRYRELVANALITISHPDLGGPESRDLFVDESVVASLLAAPPEAELPVEEPAEALPDSI